MAAAMAMRNYGSYNQNEENPGESSGFGGPPPGVPPGGGGRGRQRLPQQQYYNLQHMKQQQQLQQQGIVYDGKRLRKSFHRKAIDYNTGIISYLEDRIWQRDYRDRRAVQPDIIYQNKVHPPVDILDNPMNAITTRFVRAATNKIKCPIFCLTWTPDGRRVVTGAATGEFTLWQGLSFSFETILQAHDSSIMSMVWSHNDGWLLSGDRNGFVKYWQSNMNNVKMFQAHKDQLLGLSFSPTDQKFASSAADNLVKIWDFWTATEEQTLRGHGAEVKCIAWHPYKSLIVSGSKDSQQPMKLWDPKGGQCLGTFFTHKGGVNDLKWNPNGLHLLSASRDHTIKLYDVRKLRDEVRTFRGHRRDATSLAWHPLHQEMFVSGGYDGQLIFWNSNQDREIHSVDRAHESVIYDMSWHPMGHVLTTCSNDFSTRFWIRNRPGDKMRDKANWPMANLPPPPLYGRGAAMAGMAQFEEEDEEGAISTPFGSIDTSAMNVKTAQAPPPSAAAAAAAAAMAAGLPPNIPIQLPAGFPAGVALPLASMLTQPPPAILEAKKASLANVKLTTRAQPNETVPGLGDVVNVDYDIEAVPTAEEDAKLKQLQRPPMKRGIQKQFEEAWDSGRRPGMPGKGPWQSTSGEPSETRNPEAWAAYHMFRATWEGSGYDPSASSLDGDNNNNNNNEDSNPPHHSDYNPYNQPPEPEHSLPPGPPPPHEYDQHGPPPPQRQPRNYRPTYGEYPPERHENPYRNDSYSPVGDYGDSSYNPDSYGPPRYPHHPPPPSSYYGEQAPPPHPGSYDPYYDTGPSYPPSRGQGRRNYSSERNYGRGAARGMSADENRNAAKRFREDY